MNLRTIANSISNTVNRNIVVSVRTSAGSTIGPGQRQIPVYNSPIIGPAQIQALDSSDLKQLEGLNIQGTIRALYMYGNLAGVVRPDNKGGDLVTIKSGRSLSSQVPFKSATTGVITVPHGLGVVPDQVKILLTSAGAVWQIMPADTTNVYIQASEVGVTAAITVISNGVAQNRNVPTLFAGVWLITKVLESWPDWTKVAIIKQSVS